MTLTNDNISDLGSSKIGGEGHTLVREGPDGPSCPSPSDNCTKIQMVRGTNDPGVGSVIDAVKTGDSERVRQAFIDHKATLVSVMKESHINGVISSELKVEFDINTKGTQFLIFKKDSDVTVAYRFEFE